MTTTSYASQSPEDFMAAAPKSVSGSSPWAQRYAADIRRAWAEHASEDSRTLQKHLGPSELGVECDRQVVWKLLDMPQTNHVSDPWPSTRGRALHAFAEDVFGSDNLRSGVARWTTEHRVTPHPEHPGTADLYDAVEQVVDDHKFLGESSMAKIRKGWPRHYLVQLLLYGLGYLLEGRPVRRVVVLAYPATGSSLDGLYVRDHEFADEQPDGTWRIRPDVIELLSTVFNETATRKEYAAQVAAGVRTITEVPATPTNDGCYFCPAYRPQSARDGGTGCPGTTNAATSTAAAS